VTDCKHEDFKAQVNVHRLEDTGRFYADVYVSCAQCDLPFHFITPDYGLRNDRPAAGPDATELRCPIAPGAGVLSPGPHRFEMPAARATES
jgi:hypothetical protein